jgi:hypothetical protein
MVVLIDTPHRERVVNDTGFEIIHPLPEWTDAAVRSTYFGQTLCNCGNYATVSALYIPKGYRRLEPCRSFRYT